MIRFLAGGSSAGGIALLSGLFSRLCLACRRPSGSGTLCLACREDPAWKGPILSSERGGIPIRSLFPDEGAPGRLFRVAKFSGNRRALEFLLDRWNLADLCPPGTSLLLPVPPQKSRLLRRDLSIPDIFAHRLSDGKIPLCFDGVVRTGRTMQKGRSRQERRDVFFSPQFRIDPKVLSKAPTKSLVIVDDLLVTGWTARSIARLLSFAGVESRAIVTLLYRP